MNNNYLEQAFELNESLSGLAQGVFWIVDIENMSDNKKYCFPIFSDSNGNILATDGSYALNAKSGTTYNHEKLWDQLPKSYTHNQPFDYYPRGRVQISNGKAIVYLNPNINTVEVQNFIKNEFNLRQINGITKVTFISDGSEHYKCYLDEPDED